MFVLLLSGTTLSGAEYRGDQSISPFMRFLRGLFWGGSGTATRFEHRSQGQTYQFSSLAIGSSKTGASSSSTGSSSQQDIWAGYGKDITSSVSGGSTKSGGSRSFSRTSNSVVIPNSQQTDNYIGSLSTSAATSATLLSSNTSSSSSTADAVSAPMPSVLTMQRASSQLAMATTTTTSTNNNTNPAPIDPGFGTNANGAADPTIQTPIGDGSWELLFLLSLYVYFKRKRFFGDFFHA